MTIDDQWASPPEVPTPDDKLASIPEPSTEAPAAAPSPRPSAPEATVPPYEPMAHPVREQESHERSWSPSPGSAELAPLSPADERTWAMLAHLSVLANLVTGLLGPLAALVIYLMYKDRSRYVAYQSMQSMVMQLVCWVGGGILAVFAWIISSVLAVILVGCLLMPFALLVSLLPLGALVYGVVGAIQCSQGQDFRYWLVGDWVRGTLEG